MTQRFTASLVKYTTDTLQTLPGATLTFAVSGSSTAKAVYADKNKATSLGSIVTADSAGIFVPIWLDGTYRATLRSASSTPGLNPADGVVQTGWPIDNIGDNQNFTAYAAWDATFTYDITTNTFVTGSDGLYYQSLQNPNFNKDPISNADYWQQVYILAEWNANRNYADDILVVSGGLLYKSNTTPNLNHIPPNASYWDNVSFNASITGPFTATGTITGNALVSTTSTTTATLVASGAITGASVAVTGAATAATVTTTGVTTASAFVGDGVPLRAKKTAATSRISTTTLAADPDLSVVSAASSYYHFKCIVAWDGQGSTTNGIKLQVNTSSGTIRSQMVIANTNATSANADPTNNETRSSGAAFSKLPNSGGSVESVILEGVISTSSAGTIYLEWAQAASVAVNTRVDVGSCLMVTKL